MSEVKFISLQSARKPISTDEFHEETACFAAVR